MMRTSFFVAFLILLFPVFVSAQSDPPPPAPDYNPKLWKEYSFAEDDVRFKFPVEPTREDGTSAIGPSHSYTRKGFLFLQVLVMIGPADKNVEAIPDIVKTMRDSGINNIQNLGPKIIKEADLKVDGHLGKFVQLETDTGLVMRMKFFAVKNRVYVIQAIVKKGERHGFNWESDFEVPTMAFLESVQLASVKKSH